MPASIWVTVLLVNPDTPSQMDIALCVSPVVNPQKNADRVARMLMMFPDSLLCFGWIRKETGMKTAAVMRADGNGFKYDTGNIRIVAVMIPTVKGSANPAISLSTLISYRFFAKIAINFITLQRYVDKNYKLIIS